MALTLKIHPDVEKYIDSVVGPDVDKKADILADLSDLALEPEPDKYSWRATSARVEFLFKEGFDIRRLTLNATWPQHRFFYLYDPDHEFVYVMEAIQRSSKTYDKPEESHIKSVKAKYEEYWKEELWRN